MGGETFPNDGVPVHAVGGRAQEGAERAREIFGRVRHEDAMRHLSERFKVEFDNVRLLKKEFDLADLDHEGFLSSEEFRVLLTKLGETLSEVEFQMALEEIDSDRSGQIEFEEFLEWFAGDDYEQQSE